MRGEEKKRVRFALKADGSVKTSVWSFSASVPVPATRTNREVLNQPSQTGILEIIEKKLPFHRQNRRSFQLVKGDRVVKVFDELDDVLQFMLQHGIPDVETLDDASRQDLTKAVAFVRIPRKDFADAQKGLCGFRTSDAKILPDNKILPILHNCGFVFVDRKGRHLTSTEQRPGFVRILAPGFSNAFTSLAEVRVFCRHSQLRLGKAPNYLEQRVQMLALRIWGATTSAPLPSFSWARYLAAPERRPIPSQLLAMEMVAPKSILKKEEKKKMGYVVGSRKPFVETPPRILLNIKQEPRQAKTRSRSRSRPRGKVDFERFPAAKKQNTSAEELNDENSVQSRPQALWRTCSNYRH